MTLPITLCARLQLDNDGEVVDVDAVWNAIHDKNLLKLKVIMSNVPVECRRRLCLGNDHLVSNSNDPQLLILTYSAAGCTRLVCTSGVHCSEVPVCRIRHKSKL